MHLAALDAATQRPAAGARASSQASLARQGRRVRGRRQGRPHAPDGRGAGHARPGVRRLRRADPPRRDARRATRCRRLGQIPLGGTATGTGLNTHPEFAAARARAARRATRACRSPRRSTTSRRRPTATRWSRRSGALKVVAASLTKIANDLALDGLGPARRPRRADPARAAEGLVDHARQGQPGDPARSCTQVAAQVIGNDTAITIGGMSGRLRAQRLHPADGPQPARVDRAAGRRPAACSPRSASTASRPTSSATSATARRRSRWPPRSTRSSATTRRPRS